VAAALSRQQRLNDSPGWFGDAAIRRQEARRARRCVECGAAVRKARAVYCSRICQWKFHGRFFWDSARSYVFRRDRFTCRSCRSRRRVRDLEVDHIVEIARGGAPLAYDNLQTLCRSCHREKTRSFLRSRGPVPAARGPGGLPTAEPGDWFPA
jgi:5-methylcytosine-specific restriction protein A